MEQNGDRAERKAEEEAEGAEERGRPLTREEAAEFLEFRRERRETEVSFTLAKLVIDASRREVDRGKLQKACEGAVRLRVSGVLVCPLNVAAAKKFLKRQEIPIVCLVGGTGESLIAVKKNEAKRALKQGAEEIRLIPSYSRLAAGEFSYLKREIKRLRSAAKRAALTLSLEDHAIDEEQIALGVKAAVAGHADGVCVRGETRYVLAAVDAGGGKLRVEASGVENAEQLRLLIKAGAVRASSGNGEKLAEELYSALDRADR